MICKSFCNVNKGKNLPVYYKVCQKKKKKKKTKNKINCFFCNCFAISPQPDDSLEKFTTTKPDKKNGISKIPTGEAVQMNDALFAVI